MRSWVRFSTTEETIVYPLLDSRIVLASKRTRLFWLQPPIGLTVRFAECDVRYFNFRLYINVSEARTYSLHFAYDALQPKCNYSRIFVKCIRVAPYDVVYVYSVSAFHICPFAVRHSTHGVCLNLTCGRLARLRTLWYWKRSRRSFESTETCIVFRIKPQDLNAKKKNTSLL